MTLTTNEFVIALIIALLLGAVLVYLFLKQRKQIKEPKKETREEIRDTGVAGPSTRALQLQAYERLILLTDRIALPNLISRLNQPGLTARDMQGLLAQSIRQEFEHNITQQIYVSAEAWDAVRNYKEQNLLIVHQVGSFLPPEASGIELSKHLLDLLVQSPKASLQTVVSEALSYEAKKLM